MSELFQVTDYEVTVDQSQHPEMNYAQFTQHTEQELKRFVQMIAGFNADYIAPQDVSGVGGLSCRFHSINGYPAIRQKTQYNPNSKTWFVWFDGRVLTRAPEQIKTDTGLSAKLEPLEPTEAPTVLDPASDVTENKLVH